MGLSNIRSDAAEKSEKKFAKKVQFYTKVRENVASLGAKKAIEKKSKNVRKRQKKLKAYDLSNLAELLPELTTKPQKSAPPPNPGRRCKSRHTLLVQEAKRMMTVFTNPDFQSDSLAVIQQHLQRTQPAPETNPAKKSDDDVKKKRKKKSKNSSELKSMEM